MWMWYIIIMFVQEQPGIDDHASASGRYGCSNTRAPRMCIKHLQIIVWSMWRTNLVRNHMLCGRIVVCTPVRMVLTMRGRCAWVCITQCGLVCKLNDGRFSRINCATNIINVNDLSCQTGVWVQGSLYAKCFGNVWLCLKTNLKCISITALLCVLREWKPPSNLH